MRRIKQKRLLIFVLTYALIFSYGWSPRMVAADPLDNLRNAIQGRAKDIEQVDKEIQQLQIKVSETSKEKQTLQERVNDITAQQNSLQRQVDNAQNEVGQIEAQIEVLNNRIATLEKEITEKKEVLRENLRRIQVSDSDTIIEGFLKYNSISQYWEETDRSRQFGAAIDDSMNAIRDTRLKLDQEIEQQESDKAQVLALQEQILVNKKSIDIAKAEQEKLLDITKNEESTYQALLAEKRALRDAFEADMAAYEAQLQIALNPASIPKPASTGLSWPLSSVVITQYFGNTQFAQSGAYNGSGHNGIDLDLEVGTPVLAARGGRVVGTGDTDQQCPYASYGKWILIEHDNGLSTLYAHLSNIAVSRGQAVTTGQVIGYGGNTGYSTGSHLHFTVYASEGVRVDGLPSRSCPGTNIILPLADLSAYLNPMDYLP